MNPLMVATSQMRLSLGSGRVSSCQLSASRRHVSGAKSSPVSVSNFAANVNLRIQGCHQNTSTMFLWIAFSTYVISWITAVCDRHSTHGAAEYGADEQADLQGSGDSTTRPLPLRSLSSCRGVPIADAGPCDSTPNGLRRDLVQDLALAYARVQHPAKYNITYSTAVQVPIFR
jgi:hypothetical protein